MKRQLLIFAMGLTSLAVSAQENQFSIDAQLRTRAEYNNGAITPRNEGDLPANFINNRARLSMDWKRDNLELKASIQHTGVWGQDNIKEKNGRVALNEAWGKINLKTDDNMFFQIGRQQLSYDDERILGGLDWNVAGNWHDAIRFGWESTYSNFRDKLHVAYAFNQNDENVRGGYFATPIKVMPYKTLTMAWYHMDFDTTPLALSILAMSVGRESTTASAPKGDTKYLQLLGTDVTLKPASFNIHGAFYYEWGKNVNDVKIAAWMATAKVGYQINPEWNVNVGCDYLSGTKAGSDKVKTFDPLFGTHHKFLGSMDYWVGGIPAEGLTDLQAGLSTTAIKKLNLSLNYHYFMLNEKRLDAAGEKLSSGLGHELDFQVSAKLQKDVTLVGGYSFMLGSETMDAVKAGNHKSWQDWCWLQLNINPRVFFTKW